MAVNVQGYLALDLIKKNNLELIKGVERATTTTVAALRTAVTLSTGAGRRAARPQSDQRRQPYDGQHGRPGVDAAAQARGERDAAGLPASSADLDKLKGAFRTIYDAIDSVAAYKIAALESMEKTVAATAATNGAP